MGAVVSQPPLVGVSTSEVRSAGDRELVAQGEPPRTELALGERYLEALRAAGAIPVILAPVGTEAIDSLLGRLDAVCLSGGPDLHPSAYGVLPHPELGPTEPELDRFELELARAAVTRGLPVLGICRGMQVLNVALGGSLHQHLPDLDGGLNHRQECISGEPSHRVTLARASRLTKVIGRRYVEVNSFHHQALHALGRGLAVAGRSPDGIVEAVEAPGRRFTFGVQWHAECLVDRPEHLSLFRGLVRAARGHEVAPRMVA
ncbi:MAG: gamma-glutamyl-gamma-aminobutyrate hydrolase family protein [Thermoleophilaceae bacterium]|nr:gamma-glutamyl-gamma-aminobutyrate hydrolase family protein [Thermoleophilaceae bacterium]